MSSSTCLFCQIIGGQVPSTKVFEDDRIYAFEDIHPQAPVHILLVPKKHFADLSDASQEPALLGELVARSAKLAKDLGLKDYRLVGNNGREAGQSVFHLHMHLLAGRPMTWPPG